MLLALIALASCLSTAGGSPYRPVYSGMDTWISPDDPVFQYTIEDRICIIFMCTTGIESCDIGMARIAITALRTAGEWRGETVVVTDTPHHFRDMDIRVVTVKPMKLAHIDAVSRRQRLIYNTSVTQKPFVLNMDADIVTERPIVELLSKYPTIFTGISGFGDHGFKHQINCGFLMVRIRSSDPAHARCLNLWKNMTATRNPGLNWDMEQQSLYITAQTDDTCPTEKLDCSNCYQPRSQLFSKYTVWRPYIVHYSNTLRLATQWPAVRGVIGRRYLKCDTSTHHPTEIEICRQPLTLSAMILLYREELIIALVVFLIMCSVRTWRRCCNSPLRALTSARWRPFAPGKSI